MRERGTSPFSTKVRKLDAFSNTKEKIICNACVLFLMCESIFHKLIFLTNTSDNIAVLLYTVFLNFHGGI